LIERELSDFLLDKLLQTFAEFEMLSDFIPIWYIGYPLEIEVNYLGKFTNFQQISRDQYGLAKVFFTENLGLWMDRCKSKNEICDRSDVHFVSHIVCRLKNEFWI